MLNGFHLNAPWKTFVLSAGIAFLSTITSSSKLLAQQITDDLFDLSQGAQVTNASPSRPVAGVPIENMFGAGLTASNGDFRAIFNDDGTAGTTHFVEVKTPKPVILESFSLILLRDMEVVLGNRRGASAFRLFAFNDVSGEFDILLFEQTGLDPLYGPVTSPEVPPSPFAFPFLELRIDSPVDEVVSTLFRAEFDQLGDLGPAVYTLDGFGQAIPEPLTILGAGTAVGFGAFFKQELNKKKKQKDSESA